LELLEALADALLDFQCLTTWLAAKALCAPGGLPTEPQAPAPLAAPIPLPHFPIHHLAPPLQKLLAPLRSQEPAAQLIRHTARQQWRLLAVNAGSSLLQAFSDGATLAVVFLAVQALSAPVAQPFNWAGNPILSRLPGAVSMLSALPASGAFVLLLAVAVLLQALQSLAQFASSVSVGYFAARCTALVKARIHSQVLSFSFPCASRYKVGNLTNYAGSGPVAVRNQIEAYSSLLVGLLMMLTYTLVLVVISPWLVLVVAAMGGLVIFLQRKILPRIAAGSRQLALIDVGISQRVTEDFQALRLLHSSGQLDAADANLRSQMGELERASRDQSRRSSLVGPISGFLPILAIAGVAFVSIMVFGGRSTGVLPSLVTFGLTLQRLNDRINGIAGTFTSLASNSAQMGRLNKILSPEEKQFRRRGGTPFHALEREIRFERVGLQYAPELPPALNDISFTLPRGQMMAIVGPSGAGKSSIADLLTGLYASTAGQIWVDNTPLEQLELASWQHRLGVVSQDTFLFNATIAANITFGTPGATLSQMKAACQAAQAAGFIESLPKGYDTLVGERGYRLSGGQRQRLSLARAILRDPELLILDEATSALDSQSERLVQEAIERFERNHTVLVIAHRLSTIAAADQILVLDQGLVVERGTHANLLDQDGLYRKLWQQQINSGASARSEMPA
jgi:ATP-binding cassette subfamily B protein/subfamily B ATP-binding cassette protein MsbA